MKQRSRDIRAQRQAAQAQRAAPAHYDEPGEASTPFCCSGCGRRSAEPFTCAACGVDGEADAFGNYGWDES